MVLKIFLKMRDEKKLNFLQRKIDQKKNRDKSVVFYHVYVKKNTLYNEFLT